MKKLENLLRWLHGVLVVATAIGLFGVFCVFYTELRNSFLSGWDVVFAILGVVAAYTLGVTMCGRWWREAYRWLNALTADICGETGAENARIKDVEEEFEQMTDIDVPETGDSAIVAFGAIVGLIVVALVSSVASGALAVIADRLMGLLVAGSCVGMFVFLGVEMLIRLVTWLVLVIRLIM